MSDGDTETNNAARQRRKTLLELLKTKPGTATGIAVTPKKTAQSAHTDVPTPVVKSKSATGQYARQPEAAGIPTVETRQAEICDVLKELEPEYAIAGSSRFSRTPGKPRWVVLIGAIAFVAAGVAWVVCTPPIPKEAERPRADAAQIAVPPSPRPITKPATNTEMANQDPLVRAKAVFFGDNAAADLEHPFVHPSNIHFTHAEAYAVVFLQQPDESVMKNLISAGVQLIENYSPVMSSFYIPDAKAFEALGAAPILGICPLSDQDTQALD